MQAYAAAKHAELSTRASTCPVTLEMVGKDFAVPNYPSVDRAIAYFESHPELNVTAVYSTPSAFYERMHACNTSWEVFAPPDNDFFPYWTGIHRAPA